MKEATKNGLRKLFEFLDVNNDKKITLEELRNGMKSFGFTEEDAKKFLASVDLDKDGIITWEEYSTRFDIGPDSALQSQVKDEVLISLFKQLDSNKDGKISKDEWNVGMKKLGVADDYIQELMKHLDMDNDGFITFDEYEVGMGITRDPAVDWKKLFDSIDKDKSGDISAEELKSVFDKISLPVMSEGIMQWISVHDKNKDGKLDYNEFLQFVNRQRARTL